MRSWPLPIGYICLEPLRDDGGPPPRPGELAMDTAQSFPCRRFRAMYLLAKDP
jgi:hypothetical protein